jgi:hypothetical protein
VIVARGAIPACLTGLRNYGRIPVSIPGALTKMKTKHLPNTVLEYYAYPCLVGQKNISDNRYKDYCRLGRAIT